ncbi:hypothetical protein CTAYLR_003738 [Chrysophaeum taylorii]|uniref:t-SNARE coiled-coil homology domain-containing protein n=1 Tax=Chrysophaeum taylorii TaxID=2483200 RepID=A0AAD7UMC0_9STRA|nr:hypothetical protein CTAYLR_003738 [Chrysophaeum taylorii]
MFHHHRIASSRDRTREWRSALKLELRRAGRACVDSEATPFAARSSETLARAEKIAAKMRDIDTLVSRLEALVGRGERAENFEVVMESVEVDCKWVHRAVGVALDAAEKRRGQRRDFERQIALNLRTQLDERTKKVQNCAVLRQKTLKHQQERRHKFSRPGPSISAKVQLDTPLFSTPFEPPKPATPPTPAARPPPPIVGGTFSAPVLRSRRPPVREHQPTTTNSRLQLQQRQQAQQQQLLLEQTSRRRLDHAHTIESEIGKLGELFSRFSTLLAQQGEVVERLDDDVENARREVETGHGELSKAQAIIQGNRALLLKIFAIIIVFIIIYILF